MAEVRCFGFSSTSLIARQYALQQQCPAFYSGRIVTNEDLAIYRF